MRQHRRLVSEDWAASVDPRFPTAGPGGTWGRILLSWVQQEEPSLLREKNRAGRAAALLGSAAFAVPRTLSHPVSEHFLSSSRLAAVGKLRWLESLAWVPKAEQEPSQPLKLFASGSLNTAIL